MHGAPRASWAAPSTACTASLNAQFEETCGVAPPFPLFGVSDSRGEGSGIGDGDADRDARQVAQPLHAEANSPAHAAVWMSGYE